MDALTATILTVTTFILTAIGTIFAVQKYYENKISDLEEDSAVGESERESLEKMMEDKFQTLADNQEEIKELIMFRMAWARGSSYDERFIEPFTEEAVEEIYEKSDGIPRRALKLAGDSVYNAIEKDKSQIGEELVYERDRSEGEGKGFWSFLPFLKD